MAIVYKKLAATKPIRTDVTVAGATFASLGGYNNDTNSESYKYGQYAETKTDYYYSKDDDNLKAVVAKVTISATDDYKAAKKIGYIQSTKTFTVGGTDTVEYDGAEYTWTATGTTAGAGAWTDEDDNPVTFVIDTDDDLLDGSVTVKGTVYTKNYLWLKNVINNVAVGSTVPTSQATGSGPLFSWIEGLTNVKVKDKTNAVSCAEEADEGTLCLIGADGNGDHEGKEINIYYVVFVSEDNEYSVLLRKYEATADYELAQALDDLDTGDSLDLTTLAIS